MTSVSAWDEFDAEDQEYGCAEDRIWPVNKGGWTLRRGKLMLSEIDKVLKRVGWNRKRSDELNGMIPGVYALSYCYTLLLTINGLTQTKFATQWSNQLVVVLCGWAEGELDPVGQLQGRSWSGIQGFKRWELDLGSELECDL